jgi:acetate kinase
VKTLVINAGSSSLKFTFFRMSRERMLATGIVERIGLKEPRLKYKRHDGKTLEEAAHVVNHDEALRLVCKCLIDPEYGVLEDLSEVEGIGHRVVHGAEKFSDSVIIDGEVKTAIRMCSTLAPLHNPPNLGGIEACERVFPGVPNIAVFDTAFHHSMPDYSYLFAIPREFYEEYGIRKYGFHGTSHKFVAEATAEYLQRPLDELKLITCHLGNGCSIAAINRGKVLDTSMGLTPLMGLVMGTRCGDIDPGVLVYLLKKGMTVDEIDNLLNKKSGLLGVAEIGSSDMRDIIAAVDDGNRTAECALEMFVHRLVHYIGGYFTLLRGADAVIFTGGIGENSGPVRARIISRLAALGCTLDRAENQVAGKAATVSTPESTLQAIVMPTNEELMIARETLRLLQTQD